MYGTGSKKQPQVFAAPNDDDYEDEEDVDGDYGEDDYVYEWLI